MNKLLIITFIAASCFAGSSEAQQTPIQWEANPYSAAQKAGQESKLVMLHFTAKWCRPCQNLQRFVFTNPSVARAIHQKAVPVMIDIDANKELAQQLNITSIPHDVFLTPDGEIFTRRNSPLDSNNFSRMCNAINYTPSSGKPQPNAIAQEKGTNFGASGPGAVSSIGFSKEGRALASKSNYSQMISRQPQRAKASQNPQVSLQNALSGLANDLASPQQQQSSSRFFKIPEKRLENPQAAYHPATNEFHPQRAKEQNERENFLAKKRPEMSIAKTSKPVAPVRIQNSQFFVAGNQAKTQPVPGLQGLEVSEMFNPRNGQRVAAHTTGRSIARIASDEPQLPAAPAAQAHIIAESNARIQSYKENEKEFAQQASMINEAPERNPVINAAPSSDLALHGKCPVALIEQGQWTEGDVRWGIVHRDRTYLFSSQVNYDLFKNDPDRYSPVLSGFDPVIFHEEGKLLDGMEENGVFMGKGDKQHIVLFQSPETREKFQSNPKLYMNTVRQAVYSASREAMANTDTM